MLISPILRHIIIAFALFSLVPTAATAATARDFLTRAAFQSTTKAAAQRDVAAGLAAAERTLATRPTDTDALFQKGIALGYRAKLNHSPSDAKAARQIFERLATADRNNGEFQMALACWHLDSTDELGSFMARTMLGAKTQVGKDALANAIRLGGDSPFLLGMAAMMTIRDDEKAVANARALAERAARVGAQTDLDRKIQADMATILPLLRAGRGDQAATAARKRLPFGLLD